MSETATTNPVASAWNGLSSRARAVVATVGIVATYVVFYNFPLTDDWVQDKLPYGILFIGGVQGTTTALLAMGLILIYRTNRFVNFAYAAMGALPGAFFLGLHLEKGWNFFLCLFLGVIAGIGVGLLCELVIRRFRKSTRLIVTVASIGLAQILGVLSLGLNTTIDFLSLAGGFTIPLDQTWDILDAGGPVIGDQILIVAVVPFVIMGLAWFLLRTSAGVALRAAAENEDRALLLGIPVYRLGRIVWMIAGALAALTYILQAPSAGVNPGVVSSGPTVLLPALAAAVVARLESLPIAFVAGAGIGMLDQIVRWNFEESMTSMAFLAVILIALFLQRESLSRAMNSESAAFNSEGIVKPIPRELRWLPEVRASRVLLIAAVVLAAILIPAGWSVENQFLAGIGITWAIIGVSLVVLTGWGGHISLGQFAFAGIGGWGVANLLTRTDLDYFLILLLGGAIGAVAALIVGLPALRIRGLFLAVTTLAFAVALNNYVLNTNSFPDYIPGDIVHPYVLERWDLDDNYAAYLFALMFLGFALLVASAVRRSRAGRVIIATRDNERAADSASVPTTQIKLMAFLFSGFIAGVAGGIHVVMLQGIGASQYNPEMSLEVFSTAVIGGLGSLWGAVSGVVLFQFLGALEKFSVFGAFTVDMQKIRPLISGFGLLVVLLVFPGGLAQMASGIRNVFLRFVANRRGILVPSLVADKRADGDAAEDDGLITSLASRDDGADADGSGGDAAGDDADDLVGADR